MAEILRITLLVVLGFQSISSSEGSDETGLYFPYGDEYDGLFPVMVRRNDFFLKAAKSVPRIGRRNDFFYAKAHKSVPRIGRRNDFFLKASKSVPRIGRRDELLTADKEPIMGYPWYRDHDYVPTAVKKDSHEEQDMLLPTSTKELPELRQQAII